jgi:hypothetical protein
MRFALRFLSWSATRYLLTFLSLGALLAQSQDAAKPTPHVSYDGPALTFDFPGVRVGVAEYEEGPTGTTVLYFPNPVVAAREQSTPTACGLRTTNRSSMRSCCRAARRMVSPLRPESPTRSKM